MRAHFIIAAASVAALLTLAGQAEAQAPRTFVSGHGSDSNPCSLSAPCRTFTQALSQTNAGGEIAVLDTAGYGAVTITKSVSIVNEEGVEAGIAVTTATDAITINTGAVSDVVNLRGLTLTGGGIGNNGITFSGSGALNVQNCVVRGFTQNGLNLVQNGVSNVNLADIITSNNGGNGVFEFPVGSGAVSLSIERVQALGNVKIGFGVEASNTGGSLQVEISDSLASDSGEGGFAVFGGATAPATMTIANSRAFNNTGGDLQSANPLGTLIISQVTTAGSEFSVGSFGGVGGVGVIKTFGNNNLTQAANAGTALTPIGQK